MAGLRILGINAHPHDFTHYAGTLGIHADDGDTVTVSYDWYVDGSLVSASGSTPSGPRYFDKDESVYVVVTPSDGSETGDAGTSDSITIENTAPTAPTLPIEDGGTTSTCSAGEVARHGLSCARS